MRSRFIFPALLLFSAVCFIHAETGYTPAYTDAQLALPGKRGACFTLRQPGDKKGGTWKENLPKVANLKPYWNYSWGSEFIPEQKKFTASEFVPMTWGGRNAESLEARLKKDVLPAIKRRDVKRLLAFNEPDGKEQANMSPELALELWPQLEKLGIPLCSPSPVHPDRDWMTAFMKGVKDKQYRVDYIGVHSYGGTSAGAFKKKLQQVHQLYEGRPLMITEFAVADWNTKGDHKKNHHSPAKVLAFAKEVLPWMEQQDWIIGYAWFSFGMHQSQGYTSALIDDDGQLTALGKYYVSVTKDNPSGDQSIKPDDQAAHLAKALEAAKKHGK
jgi:hypothetical protein